MAFQYHNPLPKLFGFDKKYDKFEDMMTTDERKEIEDLLKKIRAMWLADEMTPKQRIIASMTGGEIDHVPMGLALLDKMLRDIGGDYISYHNPVVAMKCTLMAVLKYHGEGLWPYIPPDLGWGDVFGAKLEFLKDSHPKVVEWGVKRGFEDILENDLPDPRDSDSLKWTILTTNYLNQRMGDLCSVSFNSTLGPYYAYISLLRGSVEAFRDLKQHPDLAVQAFDKLYKFQVAVYKYLMEQTKAASFKVTDSMTSPTYTSPAWYAKFCEPYQRRLVQELAPAPGIMSGGGMGRTDFTPLLETFADMGYKTFSFGPPTDLKKMKELSKEKGIFLAHWTLTCIQMRDCTPQEIEDLVIENLKIGAPGGLYVLGSDGLDADTPDENIYAARRAVLKYGRRK